MTDSASAALLFFQIALILGLCGVMARVTARLGQPRVVAEMLTGFVLGPSLLGLISPVSHTVFPPESLRAIYVLSQFGLVLYMFCVGLDFRLDLMAGVRRRALAVSVAGIAGPFALGGALALMLHSRGGFFPVAIGPVSAALFVGAAMSITAFPVLARIIQERGIGGTSIGALTLSAGAIGDAAAWMILAVVLSSVAGEAAGALVTVIGAIGFTAVAVWLLRPWLRRLGDRTVGDGVTTTAFLTVMALLMLAAWFTERIGVHAVYGAFVLGACVPRGRLADELKRRIEPVTSGVLVPLFFVYAGLHTELQRLGSPALWLLTLLVFLTACGGKGIFCFLAARATGASTRSALAIATLMNARGMVELILLNIGLSRGLITPTLYAMLVLMAVGTTMMTGPLFSLVWTPAPTHELDPDPAIAATGRP